MAPQHLTWSAKALKSGPSNAASSACKACKISNSKLYCTVCGTSTSMYTAACTLQLAYIILGRSASATAACNAKPCRHCRPCYRAHQQAQQHTCVHMHTCAMVTCRNAHIRIGTYAHTCSRFIAPSILSSTCCRRSSFNANCKLSLPTAMVAACIRACTRVGMHCDWQIALPR